MTHSSTVVKLMKLHHRWHVAEMEESLTLLVSLLLLLTNGPHNRACEQTVALEPWIKNSTRAMFKRGFRLGEPYA